jgi:ubiquinone/menaquinone biosynthesis C-methylase UbiE
MTSKQQAAWLDDHHLAYHERQFNTQYRSTAHLIAFARRFLDGRRSILDVACGACATMFHLHQAIGGEWTGVECSAPALDLARTLLPKYGMKTVPRLICGDMYRMPELLPGEKFDAVLSCQTLSWLPSYEKALSGLLAMCSPGGVVIITSLFSDTFVDAKIEITEYPEGRFDLPRLPAYYNVYSLERFRQFCLGAGALEVIAQDFDIDVDLARPENRLMGTYTRRTDEGKRLQLSGPLLMPWKFVAVQM